MRPLAAFAVGLALATACGTAAPRSSSSSSASAPSSAATGEILSTPPPGGTLTASYARAQPAPRAIGPAAGAIAGGLGYPSKHLPPQAIYAVSIDGRRFYHVQSVATQQHYTMRGVAAGDYFVLSAVVPTGHQDIATGARTGTVPPRFGSGYTRAVPCGLSVACTDHSLIPVHVAPGFQTNNINPVDWYAGPDAYPFMPSGEPPASELAPPTAPFDYLEAAARYWAQVRTGGRYVTDPEACPVNEACVWLDNEFWVGHDAGYYVGSAGSNDDIQDCAFYFVRTTSWQPLEMRCSLHTISNSSQPRQFVTLGGGVRVSLGSGEQGCVNVHSAPAISARVVVCLTDGTLVSTDQGPNYYPTSGSISNRDVWWHLAGTGWIVDEYLGAIS